MVSSVNETSPPRPLDDAATDARRSWIVNGDWLHPCEVGGRRTWVHSADLQNRRPGMFRLLCLRAQALGVQLLVERRKSPTCAPSCRRAAWLPMIALNVALALPVNAEPVNVKLSELGHSATHNGDDSQGHVTLMAMPSSPEQSHPLQALPSMPPLQETRSIASQEIAALFQTRLLAADEAPFDVQRVSQALGEYYSRFPQVRELFAYLKHHEWSMIYQSDTYQTSVKGTRFKVDSIVVAFDPAIGAQFKFNRGCVDKPAFCYASPADVLLHELLHVKTVLEESKAGRVEALAAMGSGVYPYQHEYRTIEQEKQLYLTMRRVDQKPRPLRSEHRGQAVAVACVTCLQ